jgi:hypothetical protein
MQSDSMIRFVELGESLCSWATWALRLHGRMMAGAGAVELYEDAVACYPTQRALRKCGLKKEKGGTGLKKESQVYVHGPHGREAAAVRMVGCGQQDVEDEAVEDCVLCT